MATFAFVKRNKQRVNSNGIVASARLTAQSAAIAATTIYAVPTSQPGMYEVAWQASVTTVDTTSSTLGGAAGFQVKFTDANDSVVKTSAVPVITSAGNTTGTTISGVQIVNAKGGTNLQYTLGYTAGTGDMRFDLSISVRAL